MKISKYSIRKLALCNAFISIAFLCLQNVQAQKYGGNPVIEGIFTADPCPLVYNDTLYLFTGRDEQIEGREGFLMNEWQVFSTSDMYDYTSHGSLLSIEDFDWAAGNAFASHVVERDGKFWWYVSLTHKNIRVNEGFAIGVAVADHPLGPYKDAKGSAIVTDKTPNAIPLNIDPAVFVDDDGQTYLFWGSWGEARVVKLKDNMIEMDGKVQTLELKNFFEAPFVHKKGDTYYMTYAGSGYPSKTEYATSKSITGPWTYQGVVNELLPISATNHQGVVEFRDNWYFVYHNAQLPTGGVFRRSVSIDKLEYTEDGLIKTVERTKTSVPAIDKSGKTIQTENSKKD
ncbi:glycoside hydrolase family 43 protein [Zunongwangia sp. HRR-M8]|uniref:glycoside hydrolase family 43 protein n=1 Tax=Zunongwangia sp. HRR-M8 TaxID=3015170 RepID=UPI0022DE80E7|nr:glycoside hydrolase family 43 protein [Zunongwangia sp. HRR-M8]WBL22297.1 glycoside hydrolase family 43 protein [Zunongwangia sp. HRR-M8]